MFEVIVYALLLIAVAWAGACAKHIRQTVQTLEEKLNPDLPQGVKIDFTPWFVRYALFENVAIAALLIVGLLLLPWQIALLAFGLGLMILTPVAYWRFTPPTGSPHYLRQIRKRLESRLRRPGLRQDAVGSAALRIAIERLDKGP